MSLYNINNSRSEKQKQKMIFLEKNKICIFCDLNLLQEEQKVVIKNENFYVVENQFPYEGAKNHFLIIPFKHVDSFDSFSVEELIDFKKIVSQLVEEKKLLHYSLTARNGDTRFTNASIKHFHMHMISGFEDPEKFKKVKITLTSCIE